MEEISSEIEACKSASAEPSDITRVLVRLQDEINWQFLRPYPNLDRENFFTRLWNFLLFAAAHSNTSVRLAAYRTTGAFLLKVTPYYPNEIMNTFSDIALASTIDMKSSAIIASSFAFISNFTALPYLQDFLRKTPVFHHFSISDPIFSEHLSQIIRNLGRLGNDWLLTLLHCFLEKVVNSKDRYLILSIAEIIKHSPLKLMNELLIFIRDNSQLSDNLELISYLFSSIDCNYDTIDLGDVVEAAMKIISNISNSTSMEIDSAFQILAIKSPSFVIQINTISNDSENILNEETDMKSNDTDDSAKKKNDDNDKLKNINIEISVAFSDKTLSDLIPVAPYLNRPSFFNLPLPLELLQISPRDGILQLTAKFKTMAKMINEIVDQMDNNENNDNDNDIIRSKKDVRLSIFNQFSTFLSASYNDNTSACMQGYALCLSSFLRYTDEFDVINLTKHVIFAKPQSWFHSSDILRIIKSIPYCFYSTFKDDHYDESMDVYLKFNETNAPFKTEAILDVLITFSMNTNEELSRQAQKATSRIIINTDFELGTKYIASKITFFDNFQLKHILSILTTTIEANAYFSTTPEQNQKSENSRNKNGPRRKLRRMSSSTFIHYYFYDVAKTSMRKSSLAHLHYLVRLILENLSDYQDETDLFIIILNFLSCFDLTFADNNLLRICFHDALWVIQVSLQLLTGLQWDLQLESTVHSKAISAMIENEMKSMNYDIISETSMDYTQFLAPFAASLKFIYALPSVPLTFIYNLFSRTLDLFPYQSAMIVLKYWDCFSKNESRIEILMRVYPTLEFVQDYSTSAIWCHLFITLEMGEYKQTEHSEQFDPCKKILHKIASYAIEHNEFFCEFYAIELCILEGEELESVQDKINKLNYFQHEKLFNYLEENHSYLLAKIKLDQNDSDNESNSPPPSITAQNNEEDQNDIINSKAKINYSESVDIAQLKAFHFNNLDIEFDGSKISKLLFSPLIKENINSPMIKTQIKQQTFPFTDDQIQSLFRLYIKNNDINGLNLLIKYAYNQNRLISLKGMMFPTEVVPILFRYLKKVSSPDLKTIVEFYRQSGTSCPTDIRIESYIANSNEYFTSLKESQHITKPQIIEFCRTIYRVSYEQEELLDFLLKLLESCNKVKRCEYVLALFNIVISKMKSVSIEFINKFISLVKIKFDIIPAIYISNCFYSMSLKKSFIISPDFVKIARKLYVKCDGRSSAILRLHRSIFGSQDSLNENHAILASSNLKSEIPSMIASGSRYILELLQYGSTGIGIGFFPDSTVQNVLKTCIPVIIQILMSKPVQSENSSASSNSGGGGNGSNSNSTGGNTNKEGGTTNNDGNGNNQNGSSQQSANAGSGGTGSGSNSTNQQNEEVSSIQYSTSFLGDFPVAQDIAFTLTYILSHPIYKSHYPTILTCSGSLIPSNDRACFNDYWLCLPLLISHHTEMNDELMKLIKITDTLLTKPSNLLLFRSYLMAARYRAKTALNTQQEETYLSDCITNWMQKCKEYDCYQMSDIVFEWERLIFSTNGIEQLLSTVCYQFVKYMPRFFPLFIGLSKFVRSYIKSASKNDVEKIQLTLKNSALLVNEKCHALSLLLMDKKEYYKTAVELASYQKDCPESDALIDSNPMFADLLKEAKNV